MCLVVGENTRGQRATEHRARVEVRPKGPLIRLAGANGRVPVHHMLPEVGFGTNTLSGYLLFTRQR